MKIIRFVNQLVWMLPPMIHGGILKLTGLRLVKTSDSETDRMLGLYWHRGEWPQRGTDE